MEDLLEHKWGHVLEMCSEVANKAHITISYIRAHHHELRERLTIRENLEEIMTYAQEAMNSLSDLSHLYPQGTAPFPGGDVQGHAVGVPIATTDTKR